VLEVYALGDLPAHERAQVEENIVRYPALREELARIEWTQAALLKQASIAPPAAVKQHLMQRLAPPAREGQTVGWVPAYWRLAAAASIVLAVVAGYLAFYYRAQWVRSQVALNEYMAQNQQMAQNYNTVNERLDKLQADLAIIENTQFTKVVMTGTQNDPQAQASVYWNKTTEEVYVSIQSLKGIARENQYQLWALVDGKPVDAGVFDGGFTGLLKLKNVKGAQAFAITVETRGGVASPTLSAMQVIGALPRG
jgi:anti-sigma-K factor RskA